jgi:hypothetical protein
MKLTKSRKKENIEKEREVEGKKRKTKKSKYQGKHQGEMVDNQRANQTAKPLKEGKQTNKKSLVQEQWNFSLSSSAITPLASRPVCVS